jgi:hypothetical protein
MDYSLLDLETLLRKYGRGVAFYAHDGTPELVGDPIRWDGASELQLAHLGDTEGDITMPLNESIANLTLPEIAGGAVFEATYTGEAPQIVLPLFLADPNLLSIISPIGQASAGHIRVRDVAERTIVLFPEELFRDAEQVYRTLTYTQAGGWLLNGVALDAALITLLGLSVWGWRGYFSRPERSFLGGHGDDGKNIVPTTFNIMMHPDMPDGQRLYTVGDPAAQGIFVDGTS